MNNVAGLRSSAQLVQDALSAKGIRTRVLELQESTRTAQQAAQTIGCEVGQIIKSLVFRTQQSNQPILALVSGANRVNEKLLATVIGEPIEKASAEYVREVTGYAIGGIPPLGHRQIIKTIIDEDLLDYKELWAAAGTPFAVFNIKTSDLNTLTNGEVVKIKE